MIKLSFSQIIKELKNHDFDARFGNHAHLELAPFRNKIDKTTQNNATQAAVLLLIYPVENSTNFILIKRPKYEGNHSNQIALPGGKKDLLDENLIHTALREAREEVNVQENQVEIISELSALYIPNSNFKVTPVLAYSEIQPNFIPHQREVESIIEVPILDLLKIDILQKTKLELSSGLKMETPYLNIQNHIVWGATGMILNEFRKVLMTKV